MTWEPVCILDTRTMGTPNEQAGADARAIVALVGAWPAMRRVLEEAGRRFRCCCWCGG